MLGGKDGASRRVRSVRGGRSKGPVLTVPCPTFWSSQGALFGCPVPGLGRRQRARAARDLEADREAALRPAVAVTRPASLSGAGDVRRAGVLRSRHKGAVTDQHENGAKICHHGNVESPKSACNWLTFV